MELFDCYLCKSYIFLYISSYVRLDHSVSFRIVSRNENIWPHKRPICHIIRNLSRKWERLRTSQMFKYVVRTFFLFLGLFVMHLFCKDHVGYVRKSAASPVHYQRQQPNVSTSPILHLKTQFTLFQFDCEIGNFVSVNNVQIGSWNQPVLSAECRVSFSRKQR